MFMAYVNVPMDLSRVKSKVVLNLSKRQALCIGAGLLLGVPLFFLLRGSLGASGATLVMMLVMLPAFLLAMYEKNGQPLEVILLNILRVCIIRPKERPYQTNNFYAVLERQDQLDKEVQSIVSQSKNGRTAHNPKKPAHQKRAQENKRRNRKGKRKR